MCIRDSAHTLVHTDEKYGDVAKSLLGRIVVVDHVDHATQLARKFSYSLRIVTLEGESLSPGGSISGGAFKNSSNLLGRRREIEELEWKVKAHAKAVDELLVSIEDLKKDRNECRTELEKSRAALQNAFIRQNTARLNIEAAQEKKDQTKAGVEDLKKEEIEISSFLRSSTPAFVLSLIHISEPTRLGMISYAVFCLKKKKKKV